MSKFNKNKDQDNITTNNEGCVAYKIEDKLKLTTMVLTSLFNEDKYYGDNSKELVALADRLIDEGQGKYVTSLAIFARDKMNLRSISHVLIAILAHNNNGKEYVKFACDKAIMRADDILEILAYYVETYGKPIPNSLKKALSLAMDKFDEYQFAKYNRKSKVFNFKDVLRLTHAKATSEQKNELYKKIIDDTLQTPYTWETELSKRGNTKEVWEELIDSGKLGYMALLRNLNNIIKAKPNNYNKVLETLINENLILKNKVLPFRYYSAYVSLKNNNLSTSSIFDALEKAVKISMKNVEQIKGTTLLAVDVSGSMMQKISRRSEISCCDIARILCAMANYVCENSIVVSFDNNLYKHSLATTNGILLNADSIDFSGGGTYCQLPLEYLLDEKIKVDRIIMLSDNMCNHSYTSGHLWEKRTPTQKLFNDYLNKINPNAFFHMIDIVGYGTSEVNINSDKVDFISGWNENILGYINTYEKGINTLVSDIEKMY